MKSLTIAALASLVALSSAQGAASQEKGSEITAQELYKSCLVGAVGDELNAEQRKAICAAKMRLVLASDPKIAFDQDSALQLTKFMDENSHLKQDGVPASQVIGEMLDHWARSASRPSTQTGIDWKQVIGTGVIGGGAALVIGLALLIPRWLWIGIRTDIRRRRGRQNS